MDQKPFLNRRMEANGFYMKPVEIIIPFHGQQAYVSKLIESIFRTVQTNRYLITLVDDASDNAEWLKEIERAKLPGVRCLRSDQQKGFGASVNFALKNPFTENIMYVAVLQSDIELQETNWLSSLGESLNRLKSSGVKMVAPMTNNPIVASKILKAKKGERRQDVILEDIHLPMYCFLCHRELFNKTGLLSEFPYAGSEDQEFAHRMKQKGYKQAVCGKSWVYHEGSVTLSKYENSKKVQQIIEAAKAEAFK